MGVRFPSVFTNAILASVGAAGAETIIATTPPFTPPLDSAATLLLWYVDSNVGASTTTAQVRIRRGTALTGSIVQQASPAFNVTGGGGMFHSGWYFDPTALQAGNQYSLTIQGAGTTGAWGTQDVAMLVFAL